jgi:hypothetical protein
MLRLAIRHFIFAAQQYIRATRKHCSSTATQSPLDGKGSGPYGDFLRSNGRENSFPQKDIIQSVWGLSDDNGQILGEGFARRLHSSKSSTLPRRKGDRFGPGANPGPAVAVQHLQQLVGDHCSARAATNAAFPPPLASKGNENAHKGKHGPH